MHLVALIVFRWNSNFLIDLLCKETVSILCICFISLSVALWWQLVSFVHSTAMRGLWGGAAALGSVSVAFGSMLWSQQKTKPEKAATGSNRADTSADSPYELKLVQILFRHGARTPLKSIPDVMEVKLSSVKSMFCRKWCFTHEKKLQILFFNKGPVGANAFGATAAHQHRLCSDRSSGWPQAPGSYRRQLSEKHT